MRGTSLFAIIWLFMNDVESFKFIDLLARLDGYQNDKRVTNVVDNTETYQRSLKVIIILFIILCTQFF